jgi:hypothetical protein
MGRQAQTRNLEIPGSTLARRPGMTFSIRIEDASISTASSDDFDSGHRIARRAALCSIARTDARCAGIQAPAGFKPESP